MKLLLVLSLLVAGVSMSSLSAQADDGYRVRYNAPYRDWDHSFHSVYGYDERTVSRTTTTTSVTNCNNYTCYTNVSETDTVYVEETYVSSGTYSGTRRVSVYTDDSYSNEYVAYYVRDNSVGCRQYYYEPVVVYRPIFISDIFLNFDFSGYDQTAQNLLLAGAALADVGEIVTEVGAASGDERTAELGLASMFAGSLLSISAQQHQNKVDTDLQQALAKTKSQGQTSSASVQ